jgi:hypothetical protein
MLLYIEDIEETPAFGLPHGSVVFPGFLPGFGLVTNFSVHEPFYNRPLYGVISRTGSNIDILRYFKK